ncbi:MAG: serine acetyltransferase [Catenibacterium sp.]|uniref:serine acetyltransferase n=1 Tax=Catenibacterium sp. TaxID=2049022 RepID=UPI0039921909
MNKYFKFDYYRMTGKNWNPVKGTLIMLLRYDIRYLYLIRRKKTKIRTLFALRAARKYGLEILSNNIGPGLYLGHAHNINVSPLAKIGKNCNLNKGCTIGRENRGKRIGAPTLGDDVWVGSNCMVVGNIHIGNDVLIAPNAYVNFDVPDHSIVIGNPAKIIKKENATDSYITMRI